LIIKDSNLITQHTQPAKMKTCRLLLRKEGSDGWSFWQWHKTRVHSVDRKKEVLAVKPDCTYGNHW